MSDYLDQPLDKAQQSVSDLDMLKGLEGFANLILRDIGARYPEYLELTEEELTALEEAGEDQEPIDKLHEFLRQVVKYTMGARQQMEQRLFGGV